MNEVDLRHRKNFPPRAVGDQAPPSGPQPPQPERYTLKSIITWARDVKEVLTLAAFFAAGAVWVVGYFATRDALDELKCSTQLNVRRLQAIENENYTEQLARQGRSELRDQQRILKETTSTADEKAIQDRIDDLNVQAASFAKTVEGEKATAKKALDGLTGNLCLVKENRNELLKQLTSGNF